MELKGIKYVGPVFDSSGYGKASRDYVLALVKRNFPITIRPISFEKSLPNLGEDGDILKSLINKNIDYNVVVLHSTPEFWEQNKESDKINIGYTVWETSKLHPDWPKYINSNVKACMVPCDWNAEVFKSSGVTVPVYKVPHTLNFDKLDTPDEFSVAGIKEDAYKFYSIFQFTERKNPMSLVKAYWSAFQNNENVALIMKTYRSDFSDKERDAIRNTLKRLKEVIIFDNYPPIYLITSMLSDDEVTGLHKYGDCLVSLDRGEGFALVPFMAGAMGNSVMVTGYGGVNVYLNKDNSYLIDYNLTPVFGMPYSPWYRGEQWWAEVDVFHASKLFRHIYNNQSEAKEKGNKLQEEILSKFNYDVIGKTMLDIMKEVLGEY
jgi:hypothetical protein